MRFLLLLMTCFNLAHAADTEAGRARSSQCAVCHGTNGIATQPEIPNLAGQREAYLIKALQDFRSGARRHELMSVMARGLTDKEIANLAAYYSRLSAAALP